jgi:hypothetical protein
MKTAMQLLIDEILANPNEGDKWILAKANELLEKEKQQIVDSYNQCIKDTGYHLSNGDTFKDGEQYYSETFKQEKG